MSVAAPAQETPFTDLRFEPRVVSFDSLITPAERASIRTRVAALVRPAPVKHGKVQVQHARARRLRSRDQRRLEFLGDEHVLNQPQPSTICDAPVAPASLRIEAALIDTLLMALGCGMLALLFRYAGGQFAFDKHALPFVILVLLTVPLVYKLLWTFMGLDSIGTVWAGLRLVDFDGNPPSQARRYQRLFGSFLSVLAAGIGLVWALLDEEGLTWHDHISSTFPTISSEV